MAASSADEVALQYATAAAMARPMSSPDPAASAAGPTAANTPAPIIEPRPMTTASPRPRRRASRLGASSSFASLTSLVVLDELHLDAASLLEERRVHAGEVASVGHLARLHPRLDQALVGAVHVVGPEPEVPEVHLGVVRA